MPNTGSPTAKRVTPRPTASTTPVTSQPTVSGSPNCAAAPLPARVFQSTGFTPAASTRTRTSVGSGSGTGRLSTSSTSGPPKLCCTIARMESMRWSYHGPARRKCPKPSAVRA